MGLIPQDVISSAISTLEAIAAMTAHQRDIACLASTIRPPPVSIDGAYLQICSTAAQLFDIIVPPPPPSTQQASAGSAPLAMPPELSIFFPTGSPSDQLDSSNADTDSTATPAVRNLALSARNAVLGAIAQINSFVSRAANAGFDPPENPFARIQALNADAGTGPVIVDSKTADEWVSDISAYMQLLKAEDDGVLNLDSNAQNTAQLSSATISLDGLGGSGHTSVDIAKFLPDMDLVSEQKAIEALSVLDFRKRIPKVMFTADYCPDGKFKGCMVGWKRMPDAAGYVLSRRNIFDGSQAQFTLTNAQLDAMKSQLDDYAKTWALTFYDNVDPATVYEFLDGTVAPNAYYTYTLQAYQLQDNGNLTVFSVDVAPVSLSPQQRQSVQSQLASLGSDPSVFSPYPVLAQAILGDSKYDWVLAGVNIDAAIARNETRTTVRKFSYLTSQLQFLYSQMDAGKFVMPKGGNIKTVSDAVISKLSQFGVSQVIFELMKETGILYFFEGIDAGHDPAFSKLGSQDPSSSNFLSVLVASIDPETLVMDLTSLASNLPKLLAGGLLQANTVLSAGTGAQEIETPPAAAVQPSDEIQFLNQLGDLGSNSADLTTFEGLSTFMRVIRIFSDYGTNRAQASIGGKTSSGGGGSSPGGSSASAPPAPKPTSDQASQLKTNPPNLPGGIVDKEPAGGAPTKDGTRTSRN